MSDKSVKGYAAWALRYARKKKNLPLKHGVVGTVQRVRVFHETCRPNRDDYSSKTGKKQEGAKAVGE